AGGSASRRTARARSPGCVRARRSACPPNETARGRRRVKTRSEELNPNPVCNDRIVPAQKLGVQNLNGMSRRLNLTRDEILSLQGNGPVFDALTSALRDGEAIAFVGAGASAGMYPLWGKFIELLADHAVAEGKAEPKEVARWKADTNSTPQQRVGVILRRLGQR